MPDLSELPPSLGITPDVLAEHLGVARATLAKWRVFGKGPAFRKLGRRVVYPVAEVLAFINAQPLRRSTSDVGDAPTAPTAPDAGARPAAGRTRRRAA